MSHVKQISKRKRRTKGVAVLGAVGLLSLAGGASAASGPAADLSAQQTAPSHQVTLREEEISDVSLATFYVFDKENTGSLRGNMQLAGGRCGGCGGGRGGCGGCGGCRTGGCAGIWWGGCGGCATGR